MDPLSDQEISPVPETAEGIERDENNSEKTEKEVSIAEKKSDSVASNSLTEITSKSVDNITNLLNIMSKANMSRQVLQKNQTFVNQKDELMKNQMIQKVRRKDVEQFLQVQ